jgi:hypothetical protein
VRETSYFIPAAISARTGFYSNPRMASFGVEKKAR